MIPKIIHYCWFGGKKKDELSLRCIESWKKNLPDYELREWNENNFDVNENCFVREAFNAKQYAFVADYVRLFAIWKCGGIYLDCDVEVVKDFDDLLTLPAFTSYEYISNSDSMHIEAGVMASEKNGRWVEGALKLYENRPFIRNDGSFDFTTLPIILSQYTIENYGKISGYLSDTLEDITIFNSNYFSPKNHYTNEIIIHSETRTIHHFNNSWGTPYSKLRRKYIKKFGPFFGNSFFVIIHPIKSVKILTYKLKKNKK